MFRLSSSTDDTEESSPTAKVGYIRRAHGIAGAVIARVLDEELDRFVPGAVMLTDRGPYPRLTIESVQAHKDGLLIGFADVVDRNTAERMRGASLLVTERRVLDEDEFWPEQLIGLRVVDPAGREIGVVTELISGQAQDRVVVGTGRGEVEVPFVAALFPRVDIALGELVLDAPQGLLDD
jgi:16S rRNA processing protein RimM